MSNNTQKVHSLTGRITPELMHEAFKSVRRNRGAAGIDKVSIETHGSLIFLSRKQVLNLNTNQRLMCMLNLIYNYFFVRHIPFRG